MIQALSHEVTELKKEKMRVESGLVMSGDAGELMKEKKVNISVPVVILICGLYWFIIHATSRYDMIDGA